MTLENLTVKEKVKVVLKEFGLDFKIKKIKRKFKYEGETIISPYFDLLNTKTLSVINSVKDSYCISQNKDVVKLVLEGASKYEDLSVHAGGSINEGRKVYLQLRIKGDAKIGKDTVQRFITILDSNDGSTALSVGIGDRTLSCKNQFFYFYSKGQSKFRHSVSLKDRMKEIPELIRLGLEQSMRMTEIYKELEAIKVIGLLDANELINHLVGIDRTMDKKVLAELPTRQINVMNTLYDNITNELNDKGYNLWGLLSGVTRWTTHDKQAPKRHNGRVESQMCGTNYETNLKALKWVCNKGGVEL